MNDTIAAVSTAPGRSGRAIVRMTGSKALELANRLIATDIPDGSGYSSFDSRIPLKGSEIPCAVYTMRAPTSYTKEDVVELHIFGAVPLARAILDRILDMGARPAEPGEFTRRAFLNGRIDLAQAEAVLSIITARNAAQERSVQRVLAGELSDGISRACEKLEDLCVNIEASIDFVEQGIDTVTPDAVKRELASILNALPCSDTEEESFPDSGIVTVLTGRTNSGKSTLFNRLCGKDAAIASDISGTTRDWLSAEIDIEGIGFILVDTAGERPAEDQLEKLAQKAGRSQASAAQITVRVIDVSANKMIPDDATATITVLNKTDLPETVTPAEREGTKIVPLSALTGEGVDRLKRALADTVRSGAVPGTSPIALTSRQRQNVLDAHHAIERAIKSCEDGLDLAASDIRDALTSLGSVLGRGADEAVLDAIFSSFCIGK